MEYVDLTSANFRDASLQKANLRNATLQDADLTGANFGEADLEEANLEKADLRKSDWRNAKWDKIGDLKLANVFGNNLAPAASQPPNAAKTISSRCSIKASIPIRQARGSGL